MALSRVIKFFPNFLLKKDSTLFLVKNDIYKFGKFMESGRYFRKGWGRFLRVMKLRREIVGPEKIRHRNEWDNWNYKAELYAFPMRLGVNISEETLTQAFLHDSYLEKEEKQRKELGLPTLSDLQSNSSLAVKGEEILVKYITQYLKYYYERLPEEGINALLNYLLSEDVLSYISLNLGTKDLICSSEYPPSKSTYAVTLKAIIGSIANDDSLYKAEKFILHFVCPQLIGKDIFDIWEIENAFELLGTILKKFTSEECEPRLIFESGRNTIEAIYDVGLYLNTEFLGRGSGETLSIAIEMAAFNALRRMLYINERQKMFEFADDRAEEFSGKKIL